MEDKTFKILFQGDSVTDGNRCKTKEERWYKNHQIGHSYAYVVNALLGLHFPERNFEFINRGVSGDTLVDVMKRMQKDILDIHPDLMSFYIGVNDGALSPKNKNGCSPEDFRERYKYIIDAVLRGNPDIKLMFIAPFIYERYPMTADFYKRMDLVKSYEPIIRELSIEYDAVFIGLQGRFDEMCKIKPVSYWCWDGVHPTENGHGIIAEEWIKGFNKIMNLY